MMQLQLFFRFLYRVLYVVLFLLLLALLLATPGDIIHQALLSSQSYLILVIAACYFLTIVIVAFIYATRLYINRSVLASIPKSWIPIEKGDVREDVRQMIVESLSRSAAIAFHARPRIKQDFGPRESYESPGGGNKEGGGTQGSSDVADGKIDTPGHLPPLKAVWGEIEHHGWASPESPDLPNLQYSTVFSELPNLIEAKALTLAPPDPDSRTNPPALDPDAVALLQRTENMTLRDCLANLAELQVLAPSSATADFITQYEFARFSTRPISNAQFRSLMHLFSEILHKMQPLSPEVLQQMLMDDNDDDDDSFDDDEAERSSEVRHSDTDIDEDAPLGTGPTTPRSRPSQQSLRSDGTSSSSRSGLSRGADSEAPGSSRVRRGARGARTSSAGTWQYRTAPTTPKSRRTALSRRSSVNSFAQTRHPYMASHSSSASPLNGSRASVIRLADQAESGGLPYVLEPRDAPNGNG